MSQEKPTQTEIGIAGVVRNQGASELNSSRRHIHAEGAADGRHDHGEATADTRCDHITYRIGRIGWNIITVIIGVSVLAGCFAYDHVHQLNEKIDELEKTVALPNDYKAMVAKVSVLEKKTESQKEQIFALHNAADREAEKNNKYYEHMINRAEGYVDHIMSLNDQLEVEKLNALRFKERNDMKKQFIEMSFAISENNVHRLKTAIGSDNFLHLKFYPLAVKLAVGLGSVDVLAYIQTLDGWDKNITKTLGNKVQNPITVPLQKFQDLESKYNQQAGRLGDINKASEAKDVQIESLQTKVFYLSGLSIEKVSDVAKKHQVNVGAICEDQQEIDRQIEDYAQAVKQQLNGQ